MFSFLILIILLFVFPYNTATSLLQQAENKFLQKNLEVVEIMLQEEIQSIETPVNDAEFVKIIERKIATLYNWGTFSIVHERSLENPIDFFSTTKNYLKLNTGHIVIFFHYPSKNIQYVGMSFLTMVLLYIIIMSIRNYKTKQNIQEPIHRLSELVAFANKEHFDLKLYDNSYKEIDELSEQIDKMILRVKDLQKENFLKDMRNIKSEIKILQNQIQPHFVLNTLNTIKLLGIRGEKILLANTIHELADLLQYAIYEPSKLATLPDEIAMVKNYTGIMQKRFEKEIQLTINIPQELKSRKILKLILQPIVENSLKHTIASEQPIQISISVEKKIEYIEITIADNGKGMSHKELCVIQEKIARPENEYKTSIGLVNTNHRIQMEHGSEYGISISSKEGMGTTIRIIIPDII